MCWKKKAEILGSCGGAYVENGVGLTETLARTCQKPGAVLKAEPSGPGLRRIPPGSARFCRVVPGSAGFRRVPLSRFAPGSVRPGFVGFPPTRVLSGLAFNLLFFCRVSACEVGILPTAPLVTVRCHVSTRFLPELCPVLGRSQPGLRQSKKRCLQMPGHCPSQLVEKSTIRGLLFSTLKLPTFIDFCIEHICRLTYP